MPRKLYDKTTETPVIQKIPDGCSDIAKALGLKPEDTVWDYNVVYSSESGMKLTDPGGGIIHQAITTLARGGANAVTLKLQDGFLDYQKEYLGVGNVVEATDKWHASNVFNYPQDSALHSLADKVTANENLRDAFNGKVFCSLMPASDVQRDIVALQGRALISGDDAIFFNSKARVVEEAAASKYNVAPFVVARSEKELAGKLRQLKKKAERLGLDPEKTKYWIKFDHLASGMGIRTFDPATSNSKDIKSWAKQVMKDADIPEGQFMPVVMDIDLGCLPEVKEVVVNMNVQAVVGPAGVTVTGVTFQNVVDGCYVGGRLPANDEEKSHAADGIGWAFPVLQTAQKEGYRGYAGIDLILCRDHDGNARGYVLEMNGRLNGSTSLLSMSHWVERESGHDVTGCNLSATFPSLENFESFKNEFNSVMYKGAASGHAGIVPIVLKPDAEGKIHGVKTIAVAADAEALAKVEKSFDAIVKKLNKGM